MELCVCVSLALSNIKLIRPRCNAGKDLKLIIPNKFFLELLSLSGLVRPPLTFLSRFLQIIKFLCPAPRRSIVGTPGSESSGGNITAVSLVRGWLAPGWPVTDWRTSPDTSRRVSSLSSVSHSGQQTIL